MMKRKWSKTQFYFLFFDLEIVFSLCFYGKILNLGCYTWIRCQSRLLECGFHGNQIGDMKNVLLTFKMKRNRTCVDNSKYEYWIQHKQLV